MKKLARNSIIYTVGTVVIAVVSLLSTMILTRVLSEQTYAQYGLLTTFITASVTVISLGMDTAYTRFFYESGYTPLKYLVKSCRIPFFILLIYVICLIEPHHFILKYIIGDNVDLQFALLVVGYLAFALFGKFTQLTARMGEFAINYISSNLVSKAGFVLVILLLSLIIPDVNIKWVALSFLIAFTFAVVINISTLYRVKNVQVEERPKITTKEMLSYGVPVMINNVMILIIPLFERIIVRDVAGWTVLSIYQSASVFYTVVAMMKTTIDNIWNPIVFKHYENKNFFKQILHDFGLAVTAVTTVGLGACILLRRWLVLILDSSYYSSYLIAPAIVFAACFEIYSLIYSVGLNISKKTVHMVVSPAIQMLISFALCYLLIPSMGLIGVGIASLAGVVFSKLYRIIFGLHYYSTEKKEIKVVLLWIIGGIASIITMFSVSFISDLVIFLILCALTALIINREGIDMIKRIGSMLMSKEKKQD